MFINSLDNKPFLSINASAGSSTVIIRDLTQSMFALNNNSYTEYSLFKITDEFQMRPNLISQAVYNTTSYAEIILKYNGIGNAFTIKSGDLILVPTLDSVQSNIAIQQGTSTTGGQSIRNAYKYIDPTKVPTPNAQVQQFDARQIVSSAAQNALPPNIAQPGVTQVTYKNGRVYFGSSNANAANCVQNGATTADYLQTVIKSQSSNPTT